MKRREFLTGDVICDKVCDTCWCPYNIDGRCQDNDTCEDRKSEEDAE